MNIYEYMQANPWMTFFLAMVALEGLKSVINGVIINAYRVMIRKKTSLPLVDADGNGV